MSETNEPTITIDGVGYLRDQLSEQAKIELANLNYVDHKIAELKRELIIFQTARNAYAAALKAALPAAEKVQ